MKLTELPTPETDAAEWRTPTGPAGFVHRSACARIEQQRNHAMEALKDIALTRIPGVPDGVTVTAEQVMTHAKQSAQEALAEIERSKHE